MATSGFTNFIDCAALKIYALPEAEISVTNGIILKTLEIDDVFEIDMGVYSYIIYIQEKDFGTWTVISTIGNTDRQKSVVIDRFSLYTIDFILPNEYKRLDYITFPSGAYINTGLYANAATDGIFTEIKAYDPNYIDDMHYIGTNNTGYGAAYHVTSYSNKYYYGYNNNGTASETSSGAWLAGIKLIKYNDKQNNILLKINDTIYNASYTAPLTNFPILIGRRYNGTNFVGNIYYCLMKNNTTLQYERKLYPARRISDSVLGMYDIITDTFYTNAGSGSFTAGSIIDIKNSPLYLYNYGNNNLMTTGGLQTYPYKINGGSAAGVPGVLSKTNTNITFSHSVSSSVSTLFINNKIDLTNFSTIKINITASQGTEFMLRTTLNKTNNYVTTATITKTGGTTGIIALNIASLTGEQYIFLAINGSSPSITFNDWWVE